MRPSYVFGSSVITSCKLCAAPKSEPRQFHCFNLKLLSHGYPCYLLTVGTVSVPVIVWVGCVHAGLQRGARAHTAVCGAASGAGGGV
jgi:hypothetical protein